VRTIKNNAHLEDCGAGDGADALHHDVEGALQHADVAGDHHAARHRRVDVTPAHVTNRLQTNTKHIH
jgi:hypothetical protein